MTSIDTAIADRRSIRKFLPTPVPAETVESILNLAARAPSGNNLQPWRGYAVAGATKDALVTAVQAAFDAKDPSDVAEVAVYPEKYFEPYLARRRTVGWALYSKLGIERGQNDKMNAQHRRNFQFFDAPVGLIFTMDRRLATGSWLDYGMFLQNFMTIARLHGLDTCAQAAWCQYHKAIRPVLNLGEEEMVVCGFCLGYADPDAPENQVETERAPASEFMKFVGFE